MSSISMDLVKELREKTQVGMMDCKKALEEAHGNMEKAIEILRKKGTAVAAKRADNATNNGRVESWIAADGRIGALVEIACETDFSANTQDMLDFATHVAEVVAKSETTDPIIALTKQSLKKPSMTIKDHLDELIAKIAENIKIARITFFKTDDKGLINVYIHPGSSIGAMVELEADKALSISDELKLVARDLCMQIAVTKPLAVEPKNLAPELIEKERSIAKEQVQSSNKPQQIIDKIVDGKLSKFYEEVCLLNQLFIKNDKITVGQYLKDISTKVGAKITVKQFVRFGIGR
jgi:elongation factor Ts